MAKLQKKTPKIEPNQPVPKTEAEILKKIQEVHEELAGWSTIEKASRHNFQKQAAARKVESRRAAIWYLKWSLGLVSETPQKSKVTAEL